MSIELSNIARSVIMNLINLEPNLEKIVSTMANLTNMEFAIFNTKAS